MYISNNVFFSKQAGLGRRATRHNCCSPQTSPISDAGHKRCYRVAFTRKAGWLLTAERLFIKVIYSVTCRHGQIFFHVTLQSENPFIADIYVTLIDAHKAYSTQVLKNNQRQIKGNCVFCKKWAQEASKVVRTEQCCLWECAQLVEATIMPSSRMTHILLSRTSYVKSTLEARISKLQASVGFQNEKWSMHLAFDWVKAIYIGGVMYLLVHQHLFNGTVDVKDMKKTACKKNPSWLYTHD